MTAEQIERNRAFLADLRANERKATGVMRDEVGGRCCLCVALDTARRHGYEGSERLVYMPEESMAHFYGWPCVSVKIEHNGESRCAQTWNDGVGGAAELTHAQIADAFEETFPELKGGAGE